MENPHTRTKHPNSKTKYCECAQDISGLLSISIVSPTRRSNRLLVQLPLLSPDLLDPPPIAARLVSVPLGPVVPFRRETAVHLALDVVAVAEGLVEEPASVAFVEGGHDLLAVCWLC